MQMHACDLAGPVQEGAAVAGIDPAIPQPRVGGPSVVQEHGGAVAVADVGGGHPHPQQQPQGVHQQVAFAPVDLLGAVEAVPTPRSVILTLWLSMIPALGVGSRP
jgi:hypothetical protein